MRPMTEKEKTQYIRSALGLAGVAVNDYMAEMIWRMYERLQEKGGTFDLRDAAGIEAFMNEKFNIKQERKEEKQQQVLDEMKEKLVPKHDTLLSVMMAYLSKFWANKSGHPSVDTFIKKKKFNNKDLTSLNIINCVKGLRKSYAGNANWVHHDDETLIQFIQDELSATKQEAASEPKA